MAVKAMCIVTKSEEGRGAYAVRMDNDENVYFPLSVTEALELEEFDEVEAILGSCPSGWCNSADPR